MFSNPNTLLFIIIFMFLVFLIFTSVKIKNTRNISAKNAVLFLIILLALTVFRLALFYYLKVIIPHYEYGLFENILSVFLYPELPLLKVIIPFLMSKEIVEETPLYHFPMFWIILVFVYTVGSFVWIFPSLLLITNNEKSKM